MDPPSNTWFLRTTLEYIRNLYACDSAVLRSSTVCPTHNRDHATRVVGNNRPHQALRGVCANGAAEHRGAMNCGTASNYTSDITGQSRTRSDIITLVKAKHCWLVQSQLVVQSVPVLCLNFIVCQLLDS